MLLKTEDKRALVKYVGTLNLRKLYQDTHRAGELQSVLAHWRSEYVKLRLKKETATIDEVKEITQELRYIETRANELKNELAEIPVLPTIGQLTRINEDDLIANLTLLILDMDEDFNVGKGLNVSQVETLAINITTAYKALTLEDVALCFHRAKLGQYGDVYDRLDLNVVNGWLNQYSTERLQVHESAMKDQHSRTKEGMSYSPGDAISIGRVARDRGVDTDKDAHYEAFKGQFMDQKKLKSDKE